MKEFRFNSSDLPQSSGLNSPKFIIRLMIIQIALFFISALYHLYIDKMQIGIMWFVFSFLYFIVLLYHNERTNKLHIIVNDKFIDIYLSRFNGIKVNWDEISEIHFSPLSLHFKLNDNSVRHLDFGEFPYKNLISIKGNINRFIEAKNKGIK